MSEASLSNQFSSTRNRSLRRTDRLKAAELGASRRCRPILLSAPRIVSPGRRACTILLEGADANADDESTDGDAHKRTRDIQHDTTSTALPVSHSAHVPQCHWVFLVICIQQAGHVASVIRGAGGSVILLLIFKHCMMNVCRTIQWPLVGQCTADHKSLRRPRLLFDCTAVPGSSSAQASATVGLSAACGT